MTRVADANDLEMLARAFETFQKTTDRPTLIMVDSHIGYGSPHKQDTNAAHGEPLGEEEVRLVKKFYGWPEDAKFLVPDGVREHFREGIGKRGHDLQSTVVRALRRVLAEVSGAGRASKPDAAPRIAGGLGQESSDFSCRCERRCDSGKFR